MAVNTVLSRALGTILTELVDGAAADACFVLTPTDPGLLRSLDRLSAAEASSPAADGGASIAAHVDHVRYGLEVVNRWVAGEEDAFAKADYTQSWQRLTVSEPEWASLRQRLRSEAAKWKEALPRLDADVDLHVTGAIAVGTHLAYHLGAIRQINRSIRGPAATEVAS